VYGNPRARLANAVADAGARQDADERPQRLLVLPFLRPKVQLGLRLACNDHRRLDTLHHCRADRAQQHSREAAAAMTADHHQLSKLGLIDEFGSRLSANVGTAHGDVGVAFTPTGQTLRQCLVLDRAQRGPTRTAGTATH
jgi:hypothetical protein